MYRALKHIASSGIFLTKLLSGYVENRHIIPLLFNVAIYQAVGKRFEFAVDDGYIKTKQLICEL